MFRLPVRLKLLNALEDRQEANIYHYNSLLNSFSKVQQHWKEEQWWFSSYDMDTTSCKYPKNIPRIYQEYTKNITKNILRIYIYICIYKLYTYFLLVATSSSRCGQMQSKFGLIVKRKNSSRTCEVRAYTLAIWGDGHLKCMYIYIYKQLYRHTHTHIHIYIYT